METTDTGLAPFRLCALLRRAWVEPAVMGRHRHPRLAAGSGCENRGMVPASLREPDGPGPPQAERDALSRLGAQIRDNAWELALEVVEEGLADDTVPSLARVGRLGQLGDVPTFISELGREVADPEPGRVRRGSALAALVRDHAR